MQTYDNSEPKVENKLIRLLVCFGLLALGGGGAAYYIITKPVAQKKPRPRGATVVEVAKLTPVTRPAFLSAAGTVAAAKEIMLQPRVAGEVVEVSPEFLPGGRFKAGEVMLKIDPTDYQLAIKQRLSEVAAAENNHKLELGKQLIAKREWEILGNGKQATDLDRELALRVPHLKNAEAALEAARSALRKAEIDLERTVIRAPFNGVLRSKNADRGAMVNTQTQLGSFVGADEFWVEVSVPVDRLPWIRIPAKAGEVGAAAKITLATADSKTFSWDGVVIRCESQLEEAGRMARVLVAVPDPLGLGREEKPPLPLLLGSYVYVTIEGRVMENVYPIPREALRDGDTVWLMKTGKKTITVQEEGKDVTKEASDNKLEIRQVEVIWKERKEVFVRDGFEDGSLLVTSGIATPIEGLELQTESGK
jgi:RND family efflux transporter MFP subunit